MAVPLSLIWRRKKQTPTPDGTGLETVIRIKAGKRGGRRKVERIRRDKKERKRMGFGGEEEDRLVHMQRGRGVPILVLRRISEETITLRLGGKGGETFHVQGLGKGRGFNPFSPALTELRTARTGKGHSVDNVDSRGEGWVLSSGGRRREISAQRSH